MKVDANIISKILADIMIGANPRGFVEEYLQAVEEVKTNDSLSLEEKLRKLIAPLLNLTHADNPKFDQFVTVVDEHYIDLRNEVDTEKLSHDYENYDIQSPIDIGGAWLLDTGTPAIWLSDKITDYLAYCRDVEPITETAFGDIYKDAEKTEIVDDEKWKDVPAALFSVSRLTLNEVHELWLHSLTEESIKKGDLLQQILVCYTIKKAQNGDQKAIDKLLELYQNKARSNTTVRVIKRLLASELQNDEDFDEDIKQAAATYLWLIVGGFRPRQIIDAIMQQNKHYSVPKRIKKFYLTYFSEEVPNRIQETLIQLYVQLNFLAQCLKHILVLEGVDSNGTGTAASLQRLQEFKKRTENTVFDLKLAIDVLLNPYCPIMEGCWTDEEGKHHGFNDYRYKPNKKGNLTLWLFGSEGRPEYGKVYQLVKDQFATEINRGRETVSANYPEHEPNEPPIQTLISRYEGEEMTQSVEDKDLIDKVFAELARTGRSERDIELYLRLKALDSSHEEIRQAFGIGTRQQQNIVKAIEKDLKRIIIKLQL